MRFNNKALPYPLFDAADGSRNDYVFDYGYQVHIDDLLADQNVIKLRVKHDCEIEELKHLVDKGRANYAVIISSVSTNTLRVIQSNNGEDQSATLDVNDFYGRVEITPMLICTKGAKDFESRFLNEEYKDVLFDLKPGDVLAVGEKIERIFEFGGAKFESLVKARLVEDEDFDEYSYEIDVEGNFINIFMGKKIFSAWGALRHEQDKRPLVAMSIYKDCFLIAMEEFARNPDSRDRKWAYALSRKLALITTEVELNEDTSVSLLNKYAQMILENEGSKKLVRYLGLGAGDDN